MTDSRWLNEYDQNWWTWPKNSHQRTLTFELNLKFNKYYHNDEHQWSSIKDLATVGPNWNSYESVLNIIKSTFLGFSK